MDYLNKLRNKYMLSKGTAEEKKNKAKYEDVKYNLLLTLTRGEIEINKN